MRRGIHLLSGKPCAGGSEEQQKSMTYASSFEAVSTQGPFRARRGNTENMSAAFVAKEQRLRRSKHQGGVTPRRRNLILRMSDALGRPPRPQVDRQIRRRPVQTEKQQTADFLRSFTIRISLGAVQTISGITQAHALILCSYFGLNPGLASLPFYNKYYKTAQA